MYIHKKLYLNLNSVNIIDQFIIITIEIHDKLQILKLPLTMSDRGLSKISCSLSLQTEKLRYDNDDNDDLELHEELIPKHIALIMDGNRRWAKAKGLEVYEGHKLIIPKLKEICDISSKLGIQVITAFAFSTENWKRSKVCVISFIFKCKSILNLFPKYQKYNYIILRSYYHLILFYK